MHVYTSQIFVFTDFFHLRFLENAHLNLGCDPFAHPQPFNWQEGVRAEMPAFRGCLRVAGGQTDQSKPNILVALHFGGDEPRHRGLDRV